MSLPRQMMMFYRLLSSCAESWLARGTHKVTKKINTVRSTTLISQSSIAS